MGWQVGAGAVGFISGTNYFEQTIPVTATGVREQLFSSWVWAPAAGTYNIGFAIQNNTAASPLNNNDWAHISYILLA